MHRQLYCECNRQFFPRNCCNVHKKLNGREPSLFKEEFRCAEMFCFYSKTYCCYDKRTNKYKSSSKGLNKRTLEECGDGGPMSKFRKVLEEAVDATSKIEDLERFSILFLRMNKQRKDCLVFIKNKIVEEDGIHTKPLYL